MSSKIVANIAVIAAIGGGSAAAAETTYQYAQITHQQTYAGECAAHLTDHALRKQKDLPPGCANVDSDLVITLRQRQGLLTGDYTLPPRQAFETEQKAFDQQRRKSFGSNVLKLSAAGTILGGLGWATLEGALWHNHRKYGRDKSPKRQFTATEL